MIGTRRVPALALAAVAFLAIAGSSGAQVWESGAPRDTLRVRPELRLDYLGARVQAAHAGVGLWVPAGTYARLGAAVGVGPGWNAGTHTSARVDAMARFLIDPFRRSRWGMSLGGGVSARYDEERLRGVALLFTDVEGPGRAGWVPFAALGIGGGVRIGAGMRRAATLGR